MILVVDQMRVDYLTVVRGELLGGPRAADPRGRVVHRGRLSVPQHDHVRRTLDDRHGLVPVPARDDPEQLVRSEDRQVTVLHRRSDGQTEISYNHLSPVQGDSGKLLLVPAIGEQIMKRGGRSVALSLKPRSAVTLTGHKATAVVWFDDRGGWTTSTAFTKEPVPFLQAFIDANPLTADYDKVWDRIAAALVVSGPGRRKGEGKVVGWTDDRSRIRSPCPAESPSDFYARWQRSPYADEYLDRMAEAAIDALKLGQGHDRRIFSASASPPLTASDTSTGRAATRSRISSSGSTARSACCSTISTPRSARATTSLGLSADHGVVGDSRADRRRPRRQQGGRRRARQGARARARPGPHVLSSAYTNIYLDERGAQAAREGQSFTARSSAGGAAIGARASKFASGARISQPKSARESSDRVLRAAALSHYPGRSGDIIIAPDEKWLMSTAVTTHGTQYTYDQRVPVIFFGNSVRAGRYTEPATPAD